MRSVMVWVIWMVIVHWVAHDMGSVGHVVGHGSVMESVSICLGTARKYLRWLDGLYIDGEVASTLSWAQSKSVGALSDRPWWWWLQYGETEVQYVLLFLGCPEGGIDRLPMGSHGGPGATPIPPITPPPHLVNINTFGVIFKIISTNISMAHCWRHFKV